MSEQSSGAAMEEQDPIKRTEYRDACFEDLVKVARLLVRDVDDQAALYENNDEADAEMLDSWIAKHCLDIGKAHAKYIAAQTDYWKTSDPEGWRLFPRAPSE